MKNLTKLLILFLICTVLYGQTATVLWNPILRGKLVGGSGTSISIDSLNANKSVLDTVILENGAIIDNANDNAIEFNENSDELILTFGSNTITASSGDVTLFDYGTINLATDALDLSEGNIGNVGEVALDLLDDDDGAIAIGDNDETVAINSSDWDISTAGVCTGMGTYTFDNGCIIDNPHADTVTITETYVAIEGNLVMGANEISLDAGAIGIDAGGAFTSDVIDFTDVAINHTGSNGPCLIRAGTYASPVSNSDEDQSGMIRLYSTTDAGGTSYDRGVFVCTKTTNTKGVFPIAGLAEVNAVPTGNGPTKVQAGQFISHLNSATAKLAALGGDATAGMYGGWFKITANEGATTASGSRAAPLWVDNQLYGVNINAGMEEYGLFSTTGGSRPDAWAGFETTSSGYDQLFYFDETFNSGAGTCVTTDAVPGGNQDARIKVYYNGTQYYIPLYR